MNHLLTAFAVFTSLSLVATFGAQTAPAPLQESFAHGPNVTMKVVSISQADLLIECSDAKRLWREQYAVDGGRLVLRKILVPSVVGGGTWEEKVVDSTPIHPMPYNQHPELFHNNQYGTSDLGSVAFDSKWSGFGHYLHNMLEVIQLEWDRILAENDTEPPAPGTSVTVKFSLNSKGRVTEIKTVDSDSSPRGKACCLSAVSNSAPFGTWSDGMKKVLGDSQDITIKFFYE